MVISPHIVLDFFIIQPIFDVGYSPNITSEIEHVI